MGARQSSKVPEATRATIVKELYFPTQIYSYDVPDGKALNVALVQNIRAWRKADPTGIVRSNVDKLGAWHSTDDMARRQEYSAFCARILEVAENVFRDLGYTANSTAAISNMWANISPRYAFNRQHNHPHSLWSGVYFVRAKDNAGRVYFRDPRRESTIFAPRYESEQRTRECWSEVYYKPIEGRLILFPAWLEHTVEPNLSNTERISIAFNLVQRDRS